MQARIFLAFLPNHKIEKSTLPKISCKGNITDADTDFKWHLGANPVHSSV